MEQSPERSIAFQEDVATISTPHSIQHDLSYVQFLPPEILATIFWMIVDCYPFEVDSEDLKIIGTREEIWEYHRNSARTMRSVSQVCKFWRATALGCKGIWGTLLDVDFNGQQWVEELLSRSGQAPLAVASIYYIGDSHDRFSSSKWKMVLREAHRFAALLIIFDAADDISPIMDILKEPAPLLTYLYIDDYDKSLDYEDGDEADLPYWQLEGNLFSCHAPKLRTLMLRRAVINQSVAWSSFNLVRLDIALDAKLDFLIPTSSWLTVLAEQPLLEGFKFFSHVVPGSVNSIQRHRSREIHLPNLKNLSLHGHIVDCDILFMDLVFHPDCKVHIHAHPTASDKPPMNGLVQGIDRLLRNWSLDPQKFAYWRVETFGRFLRLHITIDPTEPSKYSHPSLTFCLDYDVRTDSSPLSPLSYLSSILEKLGETPLREHKTWLSLDLQEKGMEVPLLAFFSSFQHLGKLLVTAHHLPTFNLFEHLQEPIAGVGTVLFPDLETIIHKTDYSRQHMPTNKAFFDFANWRCQVGKPVPHVELWYWENSANMPPYLLEVDCWTGEI